MTSQGKIQEFELNKLKELENFISNKAESLGNCRYAFSVILSEEKYNELICLYGETHFGNHDIEKYPWCHLKLLTETCARKFRENDERRLEELLAKETGSQEILYWDNIPKIIEKLNLKQIRKKGGSWHIYAKIIFHSGVPVAYFKRIFEITKEKFKSSNKLDDIVTKLCEQEDIFKYERFSKFFKKAFESPTEKKMLFRWFVRLIDISNHTHNIDENLRDYLPPYLLTCLKNYLKENSEDIEEKIKNDINERNKKSTKQGLKLNPDAGLLEYLIDISGNRENINKTDVPPHWKKTLEKAKKRYSPMLYFPINPSDLSQKAPFADKAPVFQSFSRSIEAIIFDENYYAVLPERGEHTKIIINNENESLLIFITKKECLDLKQMPNCRCIDGFLSDHWWDWYYYEYEVLPSDKTLNLNIPQPYGKIAISSRYTQSNIRGEWLSEVEFVKTSSNIRQFGGDNPPFLKIKSDLFASDDNKPYVLAQFFDENKDTLMEDKGKLTFEDKAWKWGSLRPENFKGTRYDIMIRIYDMSDGSIRLADFSCIWYPSLYIEVEPDHILWTDEKCVIRLKGTLLKNNVHSDIDNNLLSYSINQFTWTYPRKPADCLPIIVINIQKYFLDFFVKLPYLSVWIQTELTDKFEPHQFEWSNDRPFLYDLLDELSQKDYKYRVRFHCPNKKSRQIFLYDSSRNERIRQLFLGENDTDSISCSELLKLNADMVKDEAANRETYLFKKDKDEEVWGFEAIHNKAKKVFIYRKHFYFYKSGEEI